MKKVGICSFLAVLMSAMMAFSSCTVLFDGVAFKSKNNEKQLNIQANLSNWGFACDVNGKAYFSDHYNGIYIDSGDEQQLFVEGVYSDLLDYNNKLYCVEYIEDSGDIYAKCRIVAIDYRSKEKNVIHEPPFDDDYYYISIYNSINGALYFTVNDETIYSVDKKNNVTLLGLGYPVKVTASGIYTKEYPSKGLQLFSFEKNLIKKFDSLADKDAWLLFETENHAYIKFLDDKHEKNIFAKLNIESGDLTFLNSDKELGDVVALSTEGDNLYIAYQKNSELTVCEQPFNQDSMRVLDEFKGSEESVYTISIVGNKIYFLMPFYGPDSIVRIIDIGSNK